MKKISRLAMQIELLANMQEQVQTQGIDKKTATIVASVESDTKLPYPPSAYSNSPSITFREVSLESIGRMIMEKLTSVIDFIIDMFSRFFKYLVSLFDSDYSKKLKEQKDFHRKAKRYYEQSVSKYEAKPKDVPEPPQKTAEEILEQHLTEDLSSTKERLNGLYTTLLDAMYNNRNEVFYLVLQPQMVDSLNKTSMAFVDNVKNALEKYSKGHMKDLVDAKMQAIAFNLMVDFQKAASATNQHFAKARTPNLKIPKYLRTNDDFIEPHVYLRDCISVVREASFESTGLDYVNEMLLKTGSIYPSLEDFSVRLDLLFQKDEVFKKHRDLVKIKKELLASKKKLSSKGINPEYEGIYRATMLEYLKNVTTTVNYAILFRQTNKIMMRSILRFINAETAYMMARSKVLNQA